MKKIILSIGLLVSFPLFCSEAPHSGGCDVMISTGGSCSGINHGDGWEACAPDGSQSGSDAGTSSSGSSSSGSSSSGSSSSDAGDGGSICAIM